MVPQIANARDTTQPEPPRPFLSHSSYTTLALSSSVPPSLRFSRPLPPTDPTSTPMSSPRVSPRPPPLRIPRKKPPTEAMAPPFIIPDTSPPLPNNVAQPATIHLPNTASTSTFMSEAESSSYVPTPPLSDATSSPPLTSDRSGSAEDKFVLPRPESIQFGPRPARNSKRISPFLFEQSRSIELPSAEVFGIPNSSHSVVSVPKAPQVSF